MARTAGPALPAGVKLLRKRIDYWRRTRDRRTPMPVDLWDEAVALARSGRAYAVAHALGVNFEGLRRRVAEAVGGVPRASPSAFVELSGTEIIGSASASGAVVELSDGAARLTVRMAAGVELDVARVVAAFRRREA
ncbi:hypothetical protein [Zavarzinia sp.]|uniref:hypothetical protein n=1 Tax=Zavarzinia sp. TaxID=2027920 RepID=UPI0035654D27